MRLPFRKQPPILVIGSAHMDVLGDFATADRGRIDKEGTVFCSIGGTAFNVAVDIANQAGGPVALYTHLRGRSPVTDIVFSRLRDERVSARHLIRDPRIQRDSGFIAHRAGGELVSAVSSMPVEDAWFDERRLSNAIRRARVVVAECNLSAMQLALVFGLCTRHGRRVLVGGVSETKCLRIRSAGDPATPIDWFAFNAKEAKAMLGRPAVATADDARALCALTHAAHVAITDGGRGWTAFGADGSVRAFPPPHVTAIRSTSGAGDALLAGIAHYVATHDALDWNALHAQVDRFVADVLRKSVASGSDLTTLETLGSAYRERLREALGRPALRIGAIVAGSIAVLGLLAGVVQAAVSLETSTKVLPFLRDAYCTALPHASACAVPPR